MSDINTLAEAIKGWKNAHSDIMKHRAAQGKDVVLHSLKKDGNESGMHDARKAFSSEEEALRHHDNVTKLNPTKKIRHNMYVDGKLTKTLGESVELDEEEDDEAAERHRKMTQAMKAVNHLSKSIDAPKASTFDAWNKRKQDTAAKRREVKEEVELDEAEDWELKKIHGEYKHLKSLPTSDVLKKHKAMSKVSSSYSAAEVGGKEGLISDIMHNRHGEKRMAAYHALPKKHKDALSEEVELDEAIKLGTKVTIHDPGQSHHGKSGYVGEIRHGAYKGAPKTYTVDYDHNEETGRAKSVQLDKKNIKSIKEHAESLTKESHMNYASFKTWLTEAKKEKEEVEDEADEAAETDKSDKKSKITFHKGEEEVKEEVELEEDLDESILGDKNDGAYKAGHQPKGRVVKGKSYGADYEDEEGSEKKPAPAGEKRGRGRPKKGSDETGEVKKYTFNDLLNKISARK